jgi:hypothetical protein
MRRSILGGDISRALQAWDLAILCNNMVCYYARIGSTERTQWRQGHVDDEVDGRARHQQSSYKNENVAATPL